MKKYNLISLEKKNPIGSFTYNEEDTRFNVEIFNSRQSYKEVIFSTLAFTNSKGNFGLKINKEMVIENVSANYINCLIHDLFNNAEIIAEPVL